MREIKPWFLGRPARRPSPYRDSLYIFFFLYFTTLYQEHIASNGRMNWPGFGRKRSRDNRGTILTSVRKEWGKYENPQEGLPVSRGRHSNSVPPERKSKVLSMSAAMRSTKVYHPPAKKSLHEVVLANIWKANLLLNTNISFSRPVHAVLLFEWLLHGCWYKTLAHPVTVNHDVG
jgi:hypothetical protein